jgi:hypothetical protein
LPDADLPLKPEKDWLHMDQIEHEKLAWMKDLPPPAAGDNKVQALSKTTFS